MASTQNQSAHVDLFDAYFRRADLDRDGRISGNEAVAFFQGSGLPKQVLAQQLMPGPGARHMASPAGGRPPKTVAPSHAEEKQQAN
ncbi:uncharacterized protein LOC126621422 isoform X6 [Malus sylvestris]|uniref:uncharacterized protein LOC126621422 isoform X6 n=1 Tax=Malus sylvestris TaxID=3752 RepID=UPI0021AC984A|nr:uncharacterized protein LOC126621422 isoform X6 [Malus sylvestris]